MSAKDPWRARLARLRSLGSAARRRELGASVAEGTRLVERALRAGVPLRGVLVSSEYGRDERERALIAALREADVDCLEAPPAEVRDATGGRSFGAILAEVERPTPCALETLLEPAPALFLVAAHVQEPGNLGALARTAHALGARALITVAGSEPYHPKALRTSKGSLFALPLVEAPGDRELIDSLHANGIACLGLCTDGERSVEHPSPLPAGGAALVLGSEAHGLSAETGAALDTRLSIEMRPGVDSLSINAAAAIGLERLRAALRRDDA